MLRTMLVNMAEVTRHSKIQTGKDTMYEGEIMNKKQKIRIGIIAAVLVVVVAIAAAVIVAVGGNTSTYEKHMELAQQYLDELQYEQAIAEYKAAIEIEPNNAEAYLALVEVYVQQGDYGAALEVLSNGIEQTQDERLRERLEKLQAQYNGSVRSSNQNIEYYESGEALSICEYDENGSLVRTTWYSESGEVERIDEY